MKAGQITTDRLSDPAVANGESSGVRGSGEAWHLGAKARIQRCLRPNYWPGVRVAFATFGAPVGELVVPDLPTSLPSDSERLADPCNLTMPDFLQGPTHVAQRTKFIVPGSAPASESELGASATVLGPATGLRIRFADGPSRLEHALEWYNAVNQRANV